MPQRSDSFRSPPRRPLVRASDVGAWAFCNRAWWLARVQNAEHQSPQRLRHGNRVHEQHGRRVMRAQRLRSAALIALALAALLLATWGALLIR